MILPALLSAFPRLSPSPVLAVEFIVEARMKAICKDQSKIEKLKDAREALQHLKAPLAMFFAQNRFEKCMRRIREQDLMLKLDLAQVTVMGSEDLKLFLADRSCKAARLLIKGDMEMLQKATISYLDFMDWG